MLKVSRSVVVAAVAAGSVIGFVLAGDLAPPVGPVAGTMKTLDQVEPRTPINPSTTLGGVDSVFEITTPGSYSLTSSVNETLSKHETKVVVSNITIDLVGFAIVSGTAVRIENGTINAWPGDGINTTTTTAAPVKNIVAGSNGIDIGADCIVDQCIV